MGCCATGACLTDTDCKHSLSATPGPTGRHQWGWGAAVPAGGRTPCVCGTPLVCYCSSHCAGSQLEYTSQTENQTWVCLLVPSFSPFINFWLPRLFFFSYKQHEQLRNVSQSDALCLKTHCPEAVFSFPEHSSDLLKS